MNIVKQVVALINESKFADARSLLSRIIATNNRAPVLFRLRATCLFNEGNVEAALNDINRAIELGMTDGEIYVNQARICLRLKKVVDSLDASIRALEKGDKYFSEALNFYVGELYQHLGSAQYSTRMDDVYRLVCAADVMSDAAELSKCSFFIEVGEVSNAERAWQNVHDKNNNRSLLLRAQLFRLQGNIDDAIDLFRSLATHIKDFAIFHSLANCYYDKGLLKLAADYYREAISYNPHYAESHRNFAQAMFELGEHAHMFDTYSHYFSEYEPSNDVAVQYIELLLRLNLLDELEQALTSLEKCLSHNEFHYFNVEYHRLSGDLRGAANHLTHCDPKLLSSEQSCQLAQCCISMDDFHRAKVFLNCVLTDKPDHQWALALHLFLQQNERDESCDVNMNDYVYTSLIHPPENFSSLDDYLDALCDLLKRQHNSVHNPIEQTLHGGTQTHGELFQQQNPLVQHLKSEFQRCAYEAKRFFESLPPLYTGFNELSGDVKDVGSWSVILNKSGYHNDHIHPMGCLSSVCYLDLPLNISPENGSLRFGRPPFTTNIEPKVRVVVPERGMITLFPSCCWHGTVPLQEDCTRITVAADFVFE